ncbi:MAG: Mov34/MPN/PAD-1 family protein [Pirellulaceae bacterium]
MMSQPTENSLSTSDGASRQSATSPDATNPGAVNRGLGPRNIGSIHDDAAKIRIEESVLEEIIDYSERDATRELGGFLLGRLIEAPRTIVDVRRFWPALDARSGGASLTFTHEAWSQTHRAIDERFPQERIVGWHHTHPGFGVFLSGYDLFIHRHYFSEPWQIALVVDPKSHELGFFEWRGGEVVDCGFECISRQTT